MAAVLVMEESDDVERRGGFGSVRLGFRFRRGRGRLGLRRTRDGCGDV